MGRMARVVGRGLTLLAMVAGGVAVQAQEVDPAFGTAGTLRIDLAPAGQTDTASIDRAGALVEVGSQWLAIGATRSAFVGAPFPQVQPQFAAVILRNRDGSPISCPPATPTCDRVIWQGVSGPVGVPYELTDLYYLPSAQEPDLAGPGFNGLLLALVTSYIGSSPHRPFVAVLSWDDATQQLQLSTTLGQSLSVFDQNATGRALRFAADASGKVVALSHLANTSIGNNAIALQEVRLSPGPGAFGRWSYDSGFAIPVDVAYSAFDDTFVIVGNQGNLGNRTFVLKVTNSTDFAPANTFGNQGYGPLPAFAGTGSSLVSAVEVVQGGRIEMIGSLASPGYASCGRATLTAAGADDPDVGAGATLYLESFFQPGGVIDTSNRCADGLVLPDGRVFGVGKADRDNLDQAVVAVMWNRNGSDYSGAFGGSAGSGHALASLGARLQEGGRVLSSDSRLHHLYARSVSDTATDLEVRAWTIPSRIFRNGFEDPL